MVGRLLPFLLGVCLFFGDMLVSGSVSCDVDILLKWDFTYLNWFATFLLVINQQLLEFSPPKKRTAWNPATVVIYKKLMEIIFWGYLLPETNSSHRAVTGAGVDEFPFWVPGLKMYDTLYVSSFKWMATTKNLWEMLCFHISPQDLAGFWRWFCLGLLNKRPRFYPL